MTTKTRKELQDMMDKHDAYISKIGQKEAARYLRAKEQAQPTGFIREIIAGIAFVVLTATTLVIFLAL
jgi:hypothetical protein